MVTILTGDCRDVLKTLPDASVNCCVTSPPYWALRDYGVAGQMGLEGTPDEWVAGMVAVFAEVRRVLKDDGTLWLNLGDTYMSGGGRGAQGETGELASRTVRYAREGRGGRLASPKHSSAEASAYCGPNRFQHPGFKPKDLVGAPWMLAFALRADGWYLRSDIIWHKPNPMPESVTDRPTKSHEYIFLLSKSERYHYDADAIKEPVTGTAHARCTGWKTPDGWDTGAGSHGQFHKDGREKGHTGYVPKPANNGVGWGYADGKPRTKDKGVTPKSSAPGSGVKANESFHAAVCDLVENRNKRSVWTVATAPYGGAHFATFPPALITPCILAGCPMGGTVLDPFGGSGTTGEVAEVNGRHSILIELNSDYVALAKLRTEQTGLFFGEQQTPQERET